MRTDSAHRFLRVLFAGLALGFSACAPSSDPAPAELGTLVWTEGSPTASVVIREFTDLQCPSCREYESTRGPALRAALPAGADVRYETWDVELPQHPAALLASHAVRCTYRVGDPAAARDLVFQHQGEWAQASDPKASLRTLLEPVVRYKKGFWHCLDTTPDSTRLMLQANLDTARALGVRGTPTLVLLVDGVAAPPLVQGQTPENVRRLIDLLRSK